MQSLNRNSMLLVHPPAIKISEPPPGVARLAGALQAHGVDCRVWDANLEGTHYLLMQDHQASDTWSRRAGRKRNEHLELLSSWDGYRNLDRYKRAVSDLNRHLWAVSGAHNLRISLSDYQDPSLLPLKSADLELAANRFRDNIYYPHFSRRLPEMLDGRDVVGFSLNFLSQALTTFAMIGFVRGLRPDIRIVLGGGLITSWVRSGRWPGSRLVDDVIDGPGEGALLTLLGIEPFVGEVMPIYGSFDGYLAPGGILPLSASNGCWWNRCSFCPERAEGSGYAMRPAADLNELVSRHDPVLIHFTDNALSPAFMKRLIADPPGAPWYGFARVTPQLADPAFVDQLKSSGCVMLKLGLESGDQAVLDSLHKGVELGLVSEALRNLKRAGIAVYAYLLFGTPAEDGAAARRTMEFTVEHAEFIDFLNLAIFNMPLNSPDTLERGCFYEGDLALYSSFEHPQGWGRGEVRRFLNREFRRQAPIAKIIKNDPPLFTSNHAPLFSLAGEVSPCRR